MGYTTPTLVQYEIRAENLFATDTVPSLAAVTSWIEEESAQIDQEAGTHFGSLTSTEILDWDMSEPLQDALYLKHTPIISVSSFEYNPERIHSDDYSTSWTTKTEDEDFTIYKEKGRIDILYPRFKPVSGQKRFRIVYTHGNSTTPPVVQKLATKAVALRVLQSLLQSNINEGNSGGSIQVGSIRIVEPADFGVRSFESLKKDINDLKSKLIEGSVVFRYNDY